jgi:hypothetical protein
MRNKILIIPCLCLALSLCSSVLSGNRTAANDIPLKEHPRPDFQREQWLNLNGTWDFRFDAKNAGEAEKWFDKPESFDKKIVVPFPWG